MPTLRVALVGVTALVLSTTHGLSQNNRQGREGRPFDLGERFNRISNGKDVITRSELDPSAQQMFDRLAQQLGIAGEQITRDQFNRARTGKMAPPAAPVSGAPPGALGARAPSGDPRANGDGNDLAARAAESFRRWDTNGDGFLSPDEMPEDLREQLQTWDTDGNGLIDLNEFRAYFEARAHQRKTELTQAGFGPPRSSQPTQVPRQPAAASAAAPSAAPLVYRSSNLPKELPAWFAQLDTNHDCQVGLYEWKASGRSIEEFRRMDRNNDGFLTVEEVLFYLAQNQPAGAEQAPPGGPDGSKGLGSAPRVRVAAEPANRTGATVAQRPRAGGQR